LAQQHPGVRAVPTPRGGIELSVDEDRLDSFVLALGANGIAVRLLELLASPVESMFFALTAEEPSAASQAVARAETAVADR
jgi:ABC-2 type transport system ATP-binding protein